VIADTTSATSNAYGSRAGTLIRYRGDTALFIDPSSLSMLVVGSTGKIVRVMAIPRPDQAQNLIGSVFGTPGFDARGRLVYFAGDRGGDLLMLGRGSPVQDVSQLLGGLDKLNDSAYVVRVDLGTRAFDTAATYRVQRTKRSIKTDGQWLLSIQTTSDPLPLVDDWAVCPDGSIAVIRGRDYHVDWLNADGHWTSSPKMPFDWQHVDDAHKLALIDSAVAEEQAVMDQVAAGRGGGGGTGGSRGGARGGAAGSGGPPPSPGTPPGRGGLVPMVAMRPALGDLPDYMPPFTRGAARSDADGNLWIRTSAMLRGQPVYDIVNRKGELFDRVQLPPFRTIAGFGPGVVYMAVKDSAGVVHLERARVRRDDR
jgi:hypothetical protein